MRATPSALIASVALAACTPAYVTVLKDPPAIDARRTPPAGVGRICLLRPSIVGGVLIYVVRDNDVLVSVLGASGYSCYLAEPGVHVVSSDAAEHHTGTPHHRVDRSIALKAGERRYLRYDTDLIGGGFEVEEIQESEALEDIDDS